MSVEAALRVGADRYSDVLAELDRAGYPARFTQTGGMCAAIEVQLERGVLLITDVSEELPWDRDELCGWGVGFYKQDDVSDGPLVYSERPSVCTQSLLSAVEECLRLAADQLRRA